MKNIVLTGFMGTGKTEVGKELSIRLGFTFIDMDEKIVKKEGMPITEIFKTHGEPYFRDIETNIIKNISKQKNVVISTGGGAVLKEENMSSLKEHGIIVWLKASPESILKRTANDSTRPLLQVNDPLKKIKELLAYRTPFYEKADIMVDTEGKTPREIAEEILKGAKNI
ncbi:MAG: shikimate kinase [Nitrospirae bacterium]|nr:shikimate kinase [Nitrospirota bacterium]